MNGTMSETKLFASHQHQRVISVDVRLAVAAAVEHNRVIEHRAVGLRGICLLRDEFSQ
jgi:hypothetical protein